jgi:hypothetical protein
MGVITPTTVELVPIVMPTRLAVAELGAGPVVDIALTHVNVRPVTLNPGPGQPTAAFGRVAGQANDTGALFGCATDGGVGPHPASTEIQHAVVILIVMLIASTEQVRAICRA